MIGTEQLKMKTLKEPRPKEGGLRERKKTQTRERITKAAMDLFLERGFEATTIDDIAVAADISKRSFFDYFSAKEHVIFSWQDQFATALIEEVNTRPRNEPLPIVAERALLIALGRYELKVAVAGARLLYETPVLRARDHAKYESLERALADALLARVFSEQDKLRARLIAMVIIGGLRLGSEAWFYSGQKKDPNEFAKQTTQQLWAVLRELGQSAKMGR